MGQKPSLDDTRLKAREWQSDLRSEVRRMDREIKRIQTEEGKLQKETKTQAAKGNVGSVQMLAKQIVKSRAAVRRLERTKVSMHSVHLQLATSVATMSTTGALKISADAMQKMNAIAGTAGVSSSLAEMRRQIERTADIEDQMDEELMEPEEEEEASTEVQKVLEEMALGHIGTLSQSTAPAGAAPPLHAELAQPHAAAPRQAVGELSAAPPAKRPRIDPPQQQQVPPVATAPAAAPPPPLVAAALPLRPDAAASAQASLASKDDEIAEPRARLAVAERAVGAAAATSAHAAAAAETASNAVGAASAVADSMAMSAATAVAAQNPLPHVESAPPAISRAATDADLEQRIAALRR